MRRRVWLGGAAWLGSTAIVTAVCWAGVGAVGRAVEGTQVPTLSSGRVAAAAAAPPSTIAAPLAGSSTEAPHRSGGGATATPTPSTAPPTTSTSVPAPARSGSGRRGSPPRHRAHHTAPPLTTTTLAPVTTTTTMPAPPAALETATYAGPGGTIVVACAADDDLTLDSATPDQGYQVAVLRPGAQRVLVAFYAASAHDDVIAADCQDGDPQRFEPGEGPPGTPSASGNTAPSPSRSSGDQPGSGFGSRSRREWPWSPGWAYGAG